MAEALTAQLALGHRLLALLWEVKLVCGERSKNQVVLQEVTLFIGDLDRNLPLLQEKRPYHNSSTVAAEFLKDHLQLAADYLDRCLRLGNFKSLWDPNTIQLKLSGIREGLSASFDTCLLHISLDVGLYGSSDVEDFRQSLLLQHKTNVAALEEMSAGLTEVSSNVGSLTQAVAYMRQEARSERQAMLKLLVIATEKRHNSKGDLLSAIAEVRSTQAQTTEFFADVLQILEQFVGASSEVPAASTTDEESRNNKPDPLEGASRQLAISSSSGYRRVTHLNSEGTTKWNPGAKLITFSEDKTSMIVNSSCYVEVFASANWCCPRIFNGFPGYYFEMQIKAGDDVAIGFDILINHGKVQPYLVLPRLDHLTEDLIGSVRYHSALGAWDRVNVCGIGITGQLWCFFQPDVLLADEVYGDQEMESIRCGDVIGIGVNFEHREVFFTRNGELSWLISDVSMEPGHAWMPACWVYPPGGGEVELNFGEHGPNTYLFALDTLFRPELRNTVIGRRVEVIYYQEQEQEGHQSDKIEEMCREEYLVEVGRVLASKEWQPGFGEASCFKRVLVGKYEVPFSSGLRKAVQPNSAPMPTRFLVSDRKDLAVYSPDKLTVRVMTGALLHGNRICPPIFQGLPGYYFEVDLRTGLQKTTLVGVTLFIKTAFGKTDGVLGVVFDGLNARLWGNGNKPQAVTGQLWKCAPGSEMPEDGVTLGCGLNFERREIFFTKNGNLCWLLGEVSLLQDMKYSKLMPMCRPSAAGGEVRANFGQKVPFLFPFGEIFDLRWRNTLGLQSAPFPSMKSAHFVFA